MLSPSLTSLQDQRPAHQVGNIQRHIITCEFPPQPGGVSDYTYQVAQGLAEAGEDIHVWSPGPEVAAGYLDLAGITVHRQLGRISPSDLYRFDHLLSLFDGPRRIVVQWVPHGYKYRSLNIFFCLWVLKRHLSNHDQIDLMIHEAFLSFKEGNWKQFLAAAIHRIMVTCLLAAASRVAIGTSSWEQALKPYRLGHKLKFQWLPVPSNVPVAESPGTVALIHDRYILQGGVLLGHFGSYGRSIDEMLRSVIPQMLTESRNATVLFLGKDSDDFCKAILKSNPAWKGRIFATGLLNGHELSLHLQACDLLFQPYPDGITTRRGSAMAGLAHGRAMLTTRGHLTESFWNASQAVALESSRDIAAFANRANKLINDPHERLRLGKAALQLYRDRFHLRHTIDAIRSDAKAKRA